MTWWCVSTDWTVLYILVMTHLFSLLHFTLCVCVHLVNDQCVQSQHGVCCMCVWVCVCAMCALLLWRHSQYCFSVQKSGGTQLKLVMSFPTYGQAMFKPMKWVARGKCNTSLISQRMYKIQERLNPFSCLKINPINWTLYEARRRIFKPSDNWEMYCLGKYPEGRCPIFHSVCWILWWP